MTKAKKRKQAIAVDAGKMLKRIIPPSKNPPVDDPIDSVIAIAERELKTQRKVRASGRTHSSHDVINAAEAILLLERARVLLASVGV